MPGRHSKGGRKPECSCVWCENRRRHRNGKGEALLPYPDFKCMCKSCENRRRLNRRTAARYRSTHKDTRYGDGINDVILKAKLKEWDLPFTPQGPGKFADWDRTTPDDYKEIQND